INSLIINGVPYNARTDFTPDNMQKIISKQQAVVAGLKKYFTGKACKQGHVSERYVAKSTCVECLRLSSIFRAEKKKAHELKKYHSRTEDQKAKDREAARINAAKRYAKNPEKPRKHARDWRNKNTEKALQRLRDYRAANHDELLRRRREQYAADPARFRALRTGYYWRNPDSQRAKTRAYRAANSIYYGILNAERQRLIVRATPKWANEKEIDKFYMERPPGFHVDHIVPLKSKIVCGLHCEANLQTIRASENIRKGNRFWPDMP
ncbi:MAG: hypothetical protein ACTHKB_00640, partial [Burkholderiaceae bacterium]